MIYHIFRQYPNVMMAVGSFITYMLTIISTKKFMHKLPADEGRAFAVDGHLSHGKPRGAGVIFIIDFLIGIMLFSPITLEYTIYVALVFIEMLTGYLDDRATVSWGRLKKGLLDLFVAVALAVACLHYNGTDIYDIFTQTTIVLPYWFYFILIIAITWCSINVTNCADGVDGLSGTLTIITLLSFYLTDFRFITEEHFSYMIVFFVAGILGYLWFNATPSFVLMGDAGSRAMGIFIAIVAVKSDVPILYFVFALLLIIDGGLGLFKVSVIKITHNKDFMKKLRTPIHDHVRKNIEVPWSNTQVVMRFAIIQAGVSLLTIFIALR